MPPFLPPNIFNNTATIYLADTFVRDNNIPIEDWCKKIDNNNDIFNNFSYLIRHLFTLIDQRPRNHYLFLLKGLSSPQRKDLYRELYYFDFLYFLSKRRYIHNNTPCVDIIFDVSSLWNIVDFRNTQSPIYINSRINFDTFYNNIYYTIDTSNRLVVSLQDFLKFKRLITNAETYYLNFSSINLLASVALYPQQMLNTHSQNYNIKHELADLVFDIKDKFTDLEYKQILDKIAEIL